MTHISHTNTHIGSERWGVSIYPHSIRFSITNFAVSINDASKRATSHRCNYGLRATCVCCT